MRLVVDMHLGDDVIHERTSRDDLFHVESALNGFEYDCGYNFRSFDCGSD